MADELGRRTQDISLVREIAASVSNELLHIRPMGVAPYDLFGDLVGRVSKAITGGAPFLTPTRHDELSQSLRKTTRIYSFFRSLDLPYALGLAGMRNVYDAPVVIDVFSLEALKRLGAYPDVTHPPPADKPDSWRDFRPVIDRLLKETESVVQVDRDKSLEGSLALVTDTLRALAANSAAGGAGGSGSGGTAGSPPPPPGSTATSLMYTVDSQYSGYQLSYFPQWRYIPQVFGAVLSTPVSQQVATGHYCFEGRKGTTPVVRDPGVHFAGPGSTATTTTAF